MTTTSEFEYFLETMDGEPEALWRRVGSDWQFLSVLDWSWHAAIPGQRPRIMPSADSLTPISEDEAEQLQSDKQRWVSYWAEYLSTPTGSRGRLLTVIRRRSSPELLLDEHFTVGNRWERTSTLIEAEFGSPSNPPQLERIDQPMAERMLREVRGVEGATEL